MVEVRDSQSSFFVTRGKFFRMPDKSNAQVDEEEVNKRLFGMMSSTI